MRNLKSLLAVLVVVAIMAMAIVPAFAEEPAAPLSDVEICVGLGAITGGGGGVTPDYLALKTQRIQAAIIQLRLLGLEATAKAYTGKNNFKDASKVSGDAKNLLAFLKDHPEYGWGGSAKGNFNPTETVTPQMIYKVLLCVLGYEYGVDFLYADTIGYAKALGLKKISGKKFVTNEDLATAIVEAFKTPIKGGTAVQTLATEMAYENEDFAKKAIAVGLIKVNKIESVKAPKAITATVGSKVKLDETVEATLTNGVKIQVAVKWDALDNTKEGKVTVKGTIEGFEKGTSVDVTFTAAPTPTPSPEPTATPAPAVEVAKIATVTDTNSGTVTVALDVAPIMVPDLADFVITQSIDGGEAVVVAPTSASWDLSKTFTFVIPVVAKGEAAKAVVTSVSFNGAAAVKAEYTVDALPTATPTLEPTATPTEVPATPTPTPATIAAYVEDGAMFKSVTVVDSASAYPTAAKFVVYDGATVLSATANIGSKTTIYPAKNVGDVVTVKLYAADGTTEVAVVQATLAADTADVVTGTVSAAPFGKNVKVAITVNGKADYPTATKFQVFDGSKAISSVTNLGVNTLVMTNPLKVVGDSITVKLLTASGSEVATKTVTLQ